MGAMASARTPRSWTGSRDRAMATRLIEGATCGHYTGGPRQTLSPHVSNLTAETPVPTMDGAAVDRWARLSAEPSPWLHEEVGVRMAQRLQWIRAVPSSWLDWSPLRGGAAVGQAVTGLYKNSKLFLPSSLLDKEKFAIKKVFSARQSLWAKLTSQGPAQATPDTRVGMVWANMSLHDTHLPRTAMQQWHRHLDVDGFLMFSCLGPDSLRELRAVYTRMGWPAPCHAFTDMHDWGDMLVESGFDAPVMDVERIVLSYASAERMLLDLRQFGRNLSAHRSRVTRGRRWRSELIQALETHLPRTPDGQMTLTFEVIYGHAYKPLPKVKVTASSAVSLSDMRQMLGSGKPPGSHL